MGTKIFDQYSLLHFAVGVIFYFFNISLPIWIVIHIIFEIVENSQCGIHIINKYFKFWPGGKPIHDSIINSTGDIFFGILGWITAFYLNKLGTKYEWYKMPLKK